MANQRAENLRRLSDQLSKITELTPNNVEMLCREAALAADNLDALATSNADLLKRIANIGKGLDPERTTNKCEGIADGLRILYVAIPAIIAYSVPTYCSGFLSVFLGMIYVLLIIFAAVIRSDSTYAFNNGTVPLRMTDFGKYAYHVIPSFFGVVPVVVGIFCDVWLGYAAIYSTLPSDAAQYYASYPKTSSFLTLATFDGPKEHIAESVKYYVLWELGCGIALMLVIISLLVNRLSNFGSQNGHSATEL